jgi:hypothetical protein
MSRRKKPVNKGIRYERTKCVTPPGWTHSLNKEKIFADRWEEENEERAWLNHGNGILQDLFIDNHGNWVHEITDQERVVAATVVQWLGTNCGWAWLEETLKQCEYKLEPIEKCNECEMRTYRKLCQTSN